jgi:hypothetical protein
MFAEATDEQIAEEVTDSLNLDGRRPPLASYHPVALDGYDRTWLINAIRLMRAKQTEEDKAATAAEDAAVIAEYGEDRWVSGN